VSLYMETTRIQAGKTASEICALLGRSGATQVTQDYDAGEVTAIYFKLRIGPNDVPYRLPIRVQPVFALLTAGRRGYSRDAMLDQAKRVAWRQALRWVQAQLAFVATGQVQPAEAFLSYLQVSATETLFQKVLTHGTNLLTWTQEKSE